MAGKLRWELARKPRDSTETNTHRRLERAADRLLASAPPKQEPPPKHPNKKPKHGKKRRR